MGEQVWHNRLKELRKGAGMRQEDVAAHLGVARTTYLYIEAGVRPPDADELVRLAALYGIPTDELLSMPISREPMPRLTRSWASISADEAKLLQSVRADDLRGALLCLIDMGIGREADDAR